MSTKPTPFVFHRQEPQPAAEAIASAASECAAVTPRLQELAATLSLSGQTFVAGRLCHATSGLERVLLQLMPKGD